MTVVNSAGLIVRIQAVAALILVRRSAGPRAIGRSGSQTVKHDDRVRRILPFQGHGWPLEADRYPAAAFIGRFLWRARRGCADPPGWARKGEGI